MKIVKRILIGLVIIIAVILIAALFVKDQFSTEREVIINKPKAEVFAYIKELKNQTHYSKWVMMDPNVKLDYKGTPGAEGYMMSWESEESKVGKGSQTIKKIVEGERMDLAIHFIKPFEGNSDAWLSTEAVNENQTKVKWGFHGDLKYMMKVFHLLMNMEKQIGKDLQTGLDNLKGVLEKQ